MIDIQEMYSVLLARKYQEQLFRDLEGQKPAKGGRETLAACPFCGREEHFSYSSEKPVWRCFVCGEAGDWIDYLQKRYRLDFKEALLELAREAGVKLSGFDEARYRAHTRLADLLEMAQVFCTRALAEDRRADPVRKYLLVRGYSAEDVKGMELGAYVDRQGLQQQLLRRGYSQREIRDSGLLSKGFGREYKLTMLWRDPAGRPIGVVGRSILNEDELGKRNLPKYKCSYGLRKDQGLIGLARARGAEQIVLVEGVLDALYLSSKGLPAVGTGGTSLSDRQVKALEDNGTKELLLALDSDTAGQDAIERAIQKLRVSSLRPYVVSLPDGYKDPDELVRDKGLQVFQGCLNRAEGWPKWMARRIVSRHDLSTDTGRDRGLEAGLEFYVGIHDPLSRKDFLQVLQEATGLNHEETAPRIERQERKAAKTRAEQLLRETQRRLQAKIREGDILGAQTVLSEGLQKQGEARRVRVPEPYLLEDLEEDVLSMSDGLETGYRGLDSYLRIPRAQLTIVAGRPGQGRSAFLLNLILNMARKYDDKAFYFFSYEEARTTIALKLIMNSSGIVLDQNMSLDAYIGYMRAKRGSEPAIERAIQGYQELTSSGRLWIVHQVLSAKDLAATIGRICRRGQVGAIFVDCIQRVPIRQPGQPSQKHLQTKRVSELLLEQARAREVAIIVGAHLNGASGQRPNKRPMLADIRARGDVQQDADLVLRVYNESRDRENEDAQQNDGQLVTLDVSVLKNGRGPSGIRTWLILDRPRLRIKDKGSTSADWQRERQTRPLG